MYARICHHLFVILISLTLSACATIGSKSAWPDDIPDRQIFVDAYLQNHADAESVDATELEQHLGWIKRFYQGTLIYPNGWIQATNRFLATVDDPAEKVILADRMRQLGIDIANEWAQENGIRNIDSSNVAVWGSALYEAANRDDHLGYIAKVEMDVAKLIEGKIAPDEIEYERYYPDNDYDSF